MDGWMDGWVDGWINAADGMSSIYFVILFILCFYD